MADPLLAIAAEIDATEPYIDPGWTKLFPAADIARWEGKPAPPREWLLEHWIPHRQMTYLTGPGSSGKSLLAQQLCTCIALGRPFLGTPTRQTSAMYVNCEDDADELRRRQEAICRALAIPLSALEGRLHLVSLAGVIGTELATFSHEQQQARDEFDEAPSVLRPTKRFSALESLSIAKDLGFVALDNVAHLFAGNENVRVEVASFVALLNRLAQRISGAVLLIGHPNKAGDSFSGSTAWENQVRSRLYMETGTVDGEVIDRDLRVLRREKSNYAENGTELTFRWHDWAYVRDEELSSDLRERLASTAKDAHDNDIFVKCLREMNRQKRPVSERFARNYAPAIFSKMPESASIGKRRLEAAMERLFRINAIERGVLGRDTAKSRDIEGLREVE